MALRPRFHGALCGETCSHAVSRAIDGGLPGARALLEVDCFSGSRSPSRGDFGMRGPGLRELIDG